MGNLKSLESQIYNCWWSYTEHGRTAHILKGRPLSLTPMYVQRDDYATELIRWLSIALRILTLVEFGVRRLLAAEEATLAGAVGAFPRGCIHDFALFLTNRFENGRNGRHSDADNI